MRCCEMKQLLKNLLLFNFSLCLFVNTLRVYFVNTQIVKCYFKFLVLFGIFYNLYVMNYNVCIINTYCIIIIL